MRGPGGKGACREGNADWNNREVQDCEPSPDMGSSALGRVRRVFVVALWGHHGCPTLLSHRPIAVPRSPHNFGLESKDCLWARVWHNFLGGVGKASAARGNGTTSGYPGGGRGGREAECANTSCEPGLRVAAVHHTDRVCRRRAHTWLRWRDTRDSSWSEPWGARLATGRYSYV